MQFDEDFRGFSFQKEGPLDMRMDQASDLTAKDVVNEMSEDELGALFRDLGEERFWRKSAKAIVEARKKKEIQTTKELSSVIEKAIPRKEGIHPATRIFQAIRIYINKELESIEGSLKKAIDVLAPGGKIGVLSFHSLEDRIVKNIFKDVSRSIKGVDKAPILELLTKKPRVPTEIEKRLNRRSRSAKLRFAKKI